jgi:hypothetical protein
MKREISIADVLQESPVGEVPNITDAALRIARALECAFGSGGVSQSTLDHLICMGLQMGLGDLVGAQNNIADAINRLADVIEAKE